jgi:diguanylate cyclase (GGDEF)-like protein
MKLDLPTLMVMQSFALGCAGAVLLFAWLQNRRETVLGLWGLAHVSASAGILLLMFGFALHQPMLPMIAGGLLSFQASLIWKATRVIAGRPAPWPLLILGLVILAAAAGVPALRSLFGSLALAVGCAYAAAAAASLWRGRAERLNARWPLIVLNALHASALLVGIFSTLNGSTTQDTVPALGSLFGYIYFESIIFALATSVLVLTLIKERSEIAGRFAARVDPLTGIANRSGFIEQGERVVERCRRDRAPFTILMFDLDRFKAVNDTHGHAVGDSVIRKFCEVVTAALRPNDVFGRLGGEEFAVVMPGSSIEAAFVRADRIRSAFEANSRLIGDRRIDATVSCGLSESVNGNRTLDAALADADAALYSAKAAGRNRVKRASEPRAEGTSPIIIRVA